MCTREISTAEEERYVMIRVLCVVEGGLPAVIIELDGADASDQRLHVERIYNTLHEMTLPVGRALTLEDVREPLRRLLATEYLRKLECIPFAYRERLFVEETMCWKVPLGTSYDEETVVGVRAEFRISPRKPVEAAAKPVKAPPNRFPTSLIGRKS